jgi:hypothetical protein
MCDLRRFVFIWDFICRGTLLGLVDIAPMSKLREYDLGTFNRVDPARVSHPQAPGIRSSRQEPNVALGPSTPGIFPHELEGRGEPSLDVAWQFSEFPLARWLSW